jgi:phosphoribosylcarboxyaminoimidazole (NCAIR) mutase
MRRIAIIVGSKSDLKQCKEGLKFLKSLSSTVFTFVYIRSQHRHTLKLQQLLKELTENDLADVIVTGAGMANHLSGCTDAYLRYTLRNTRIPVIGVAFEDPKSEENTNAAILSMKCVPKTQLIFRNEFDVFCGPDGFLEACELAVSEDLPKPHLPEPVEYLDLTLEEAMFLAGD